MPDVKEIYLEPGYYFPPGVYQDFWENRIENVFSEDIKNKHIKLRPHREMWVGAMVAAAHTKNTKEKHYVGLPPDEPPDVLIVRLRHEKMKSGRIGTVVESLKVEITRCSMRDQENLIEQIKNKNTPAYKGMTLAVYLYGDDESFAMDKLREQILELGTIHLREILVICKVSNMLGKDLAPGTYSQIFLHPVVAHTEFNVNDKSLFFKDPGILTANTRGVSTELTSTGKYRLLPPEI